MIDRHDSSAGLPAIRDAAELAVFQSGGWTSFVTTGGTSLAKLGINATSDLGNRLSVASEGTLLSHDGAGHRLAINKATTSDTASVLLEDDFSARGEIGLTGDDALHVKVSPDGSSWLEAISIDEATGLVSLPQGQLAFPAAQNASSDAHTLDDYEEGTWTPALNFGGAATGITYASTPVGRYTKIGRSVIVTGTVTTW